MENILQSFLDEGKIVLSNDDDLEKLKNASNGFEEYLRESPEQIISYFLIGLVPDSGSDLEEFSVVLKKVKEFWPTFLSGNPKNSDVQHTYLRAVILHSMASMVKSNPQVGHVFWLISRNLIRYINAESWSQKMLNELSTAYFNESVTAFNPVIGDLQGKGGEKFDEEKSEFFDESELVNVFQRAATPTGQEQGGSQNQYWVTNSVVNNQNWSKDFYPIAGKGLSEILNKIIQGIRTENVENYKKALAISQEIQKNLIQKKENIGNIKNELIWWKETLYSRQIKNSYRNVEPDLVLFLVAWDLSKLVDPIFPQSIDYLLEETIRKFYTSPTQSFKLGSSLAPYANILKDWGIELDYEVSGSQLPLAVSLSRISDLNASSLSIFENQTRLKQDIELSPIEFAQWIFHDLLALNLMREVQISLKNEEEPISKGEDLKDELEHNVTEEDQNEEEV